MWRESNEETGPVQKEEVKTERRGMEAETKHPTPEEDKDLGSGCPSSTSLAQQEALAAGLISPTSALSKAPSILERATALSHTLEAPTSQKKSPSISPVSPQTVELSLSVQEKILSTMPYTPEISQEEKYPGTAPGTGVLRNSKQHPAKTEPADQRTERPLSE